MANSPVQVILNADAFRRPKDVHAGGSVTDFFAGNDAGFARHRSSVARQLTAASTLLQQSPFGGIGFAKVSLQKKAWAKSHRPVSSLFVQSRTPSVGAADVGQLIVEVNPETLAEVSHSVAQAEDTPALRPDKKTGELKPRPTRRREEVGAIEQITLWGPSDRRHFSAEEAVAWLSDRRTGGAYRVHLFRSPEAENPTAQHIARRRKLLDTLAEGLRTLGSGIVARFDPIATPGRPLLSIALTTASTPPAISLSIGDVPVAERRATLDDSLARHQKLFDLLDNHPLVREVELPPMIVQSGNTSFPTVSLSVPVPRPGKGPHALVGVIDGGIGACLTDWVETRWGLLAEEDRAESHGTFIGGLLVAGQAVNSPAVIPETDACKVVDVDIFPADDAAFPQYYPNGSTDFFTELGNAAASLRKKHGVRVFNLSINMLKMSDVDGYSAEAGMLDRIAHEHDLLFVISAGNLRPSRAEWPSDHAAVLSQLASRRDDGILIPAESARNLSVTALNPPGHPTALPFAPAAYTRRGPGLRTGVKPDLCHIGGADSTHAVHESGLFSYAPDGTNCSGRGTSYAAPLVAKTLAALDSTVAGGLTREALLALALHHARLPVPLSTPQLAGVARHLGGFGIPATADEMLTSGDHQITLVFNSRLQEGQELRFDFAWPPSLVGEGGKCSGLAELTLVASPPLDYAYGAEFVRANIDAHLRQEDGDGYKGRLEAAYLPISTEAHTYESELIEHGLKWSPSKVYRKRMPRGVGKSSNWRLVIEQLSRQGERVPEEGIPFTAILTITDLKGEAPVFAEMRQSLQARNIQTVDIRTATRITAQG